MYSYDVIIMYGVQITVQVLCTRTMYRDVHVLVRCKVQYKVLCTRTEYVYRHLVHVPTHHARVHESYVHVFEWNSLQPLPAPRPPQPCLPAGLARHSTID